jgi:hypothetical protein
VSPAARIRSLSEALAALRDPQAPESFSPLTGEPLLVVDLTGGGDVAAETGGLSQMPCPTVALAPTRAAGDARILAAHFDLLLESEAELPEIEGAVERSPLAALALVQLLRHGERLDVHAGLVAESWVYSMLQAGPEFARWRAGHSPRPRSEADEGPAVVVHRERDRLHITLNRPGKHNAFSIDMRDGLVEALHLAQMDTSIRQVVLAGAGPSFCSGGDLDEFGTFVDPATAHAVRSTRNAGRALAAVADRVCAEVHGTCVGAGVELPAFAARVVAHAATTFELPEVGMGLVPGAGGTASLPRRIGRQRTAWLALTGRKLDAQTALDWGLVDEIRGG